MNEFGKLIRSYREKSRFPETGQQLTQAQLGKLVGRELGMNGGYTAAAVSEWERGKSHIRDRLVLIQLLKVLHGCGGLSTLAQANELLETDDYRSLNENERRQVFPEEPLEIVQRPNLPLARIEQVIIRVFQPPDKQRTAKKWVVAILVILGVVGIALDMGFLIGLSRTPTVMPKLAGWQASLNPLDYSRWDEVSAIWQDAKPGAMLTEHNPAQNFGKVESELIVLNVDQYPILHINITKVDPGASLTLQIRDQQIFVDKDVLKNLKATGDYKVNIAEVMGWQNIHSFTINVWIDGDGKSITLDLIRIETK